MFSRPAAGIFVVQSGGGDRRAERRRPVRRFAANLTTDIRKKGQSAKGRDSENGRTRRRSTGRSGRAPRIPAPAAAYAAGIRPDRSRRMRRPIGICPTDRRCVRSARRERSGVFGRAVCIRPAASRGGRLGSPAVAESPYGYGDRPAVRLMETESGPSLVGKPAFESLAAFRIISSARQERPWRSRRPDRRSPSGKPR